LGPFGTAATNRPIVPIPGDYYDNREIGGNDLQRKPKYSEIKCVSAALSNTNPHMLPGREPGPPPCEAGD
jgi:hypothetical protein